MTDFTKPYKDAYGRICLLRGEKCFYLAPALPGSPLMCSIDRVWTDKNGRTWRTPTRRKVKNEKIRQQLLTANL